MWVLDTNTVIYYFKGMGRVTDRVLEVSPRDIAVPAIVLYELEVGVAKSETATTRQRQIEELSDSVQILPFGSLEASVSAGIRAALEKAGTPIGPLDTLIAGTALANNATLVTHNVREFRRVEGLRVEDWFD